MTEKAASGHAIRNAEGEADSMAPAANQGRRDQIERGSLAEAGKVNGVFGHVLYQRLNAYTGSVDEFGCPGNTVDSWRLQFTSREIGLKAANASISIKRRG